MGTPQVAYKETITKTVECEETFLRELNGKSTYAQVRFRLSPLSPLELYREAKISSLIAFYQKKYPRNSINQLKKRL